MPLPSRNLAIALLLAATLGASASAASAAPRCPTGIDHPAVPPIHGLAYDTARKKLIAAGWKPQRARMADGSMKGVGQDLYGNAEAFWSRGYFEVGECAGTGLAQCEFHFVDGRGDRLEITTAGEETETDHASVVDTRLRCRT